MKKQPIFKGIALSLIMSAFALSNCGNTESLTDSSVSDENPIQYNSDQTVEAYSEKGLPANTGLLSLKISGFQSEDFNVLQGYVVIKSVEVKPDEEESEWITVSNYGSEGKVFEPVAGQESTYLIDNFELAPNAYKKIRLNIDEEQSKVQVNDNGQTKWVELSHHSDDENRLKVKYNFTMENQYVLTMALEVEVENKSGHRHGNHHDNDSDDENNNARNSSHKQESHEDSRDDESEHVKINLDVASVVSAPFSEVFPKQPDVPAAPGNEIPKTDPTPGNGGIPAAPAAPATPGNEIPAIDPIPGNGGTPVPAINWKVQASPVTANLLAITDKGTEKIAVGFLNSGVSSLDGILWNLDKFPITNLNINGIATNGTRLIAVGNSGLIYNDTYTRGIRVWAKSTYTANSITAASLFAIAYGNNKFVAVGERGLIFTSADGLTWQQLFLKTSPNLRSIIWNGVNFIAAGDSGTVMYSVDGLSWNTAPVFSSTSSLRGVASNGTMTVIVGLNGEIWQTRDMIIFTRVSLGATTNLNGIVWTGSMFIAVGDAGFIATSVDGLNWTTGTPVTTNNLRGITSTLGINGITQTTIVGDNGVILTSY